VLVAFLLLLIFPTLRTPSVVASGTQPSAVSLPLKGDTLPFLANATYLGPANVSQTITLGFYLNDSKLALESHGNVSARASVETSLTNWESSAGLAPGVAECTTTWTARNVNGSLSSAKNLEPCSTNKLETRTTIGRAEALLGVTINLYSYENETFYANSGDPVMPMTVNNGTVIDITGLNDYTPNFVFTQSIGGVTSLIPSDVYGFYDFSSMFSAGHKGAGRTIGIVGAPLCGISLSDVTAFWNNYGIPWSSLQEISLNGGIPAEGCASGGDVEEALDSEWSGATGQTANIVLVTENDNQKTWSQQVFDILGALVHHYNPDVITSSVAPEWLQGAPTSDLNEIFQLTTSAMANGTSIVAASGDSGLNSNTDPIAADPYVTAVGGVDDTLNNPGNSPGILGQSAWHLSGGGQNTYYNQPQYQKSEAVKAPSNGYRDYPDLAFPSAPAIAVYYSGGFIQAAGTSFASPMIAGMVADIDSYVNSQLGSSNWRAGFLNPALYDLGYNSFYGHKAFNDITTSDSGSCATTGWDYCTGIGTPDAWNLAQDFGQMYDQPNPTTSTFQDTFSSGLDGWSYAGHSGYTLTTDSSTGQPAPSALISGDCSACGQVQMQKTITLDSLPSGTPYVLSFWWRAKSSTTLSTVTNAQVAIIQVGSDTVLYQANLVEGGTTDTGWKYFSTDITSALGGATNIQIWLYMNDAWSTNWNQENWYDDVSISNHLINDQFSNSLNSWAICGNTGYQISKDTSTGDPAPSALISGDSNAGGFSGMCSTVTWSGSGTFVVSFEWRATSTYSGSTVTNAQFEVIDPNGNVVLDSQNLIGGGVTDSGWHTASIDASYYVQGHSTVIVELYLNDWWSANWSQKNWYDNVVLLSSN